MPQELLCMIFRSNRAIGFLVARFLYGGVTAPLEIEYCLPHDATTDIISTVYRSEVNDVLETGLPTPNCNAKQQLTLETGHLLNVEDRLALGEEGVRVDLPHK